MSTFSPDGIVERVRPSFDQTMLRLGYSHIQGLYYRAHPSRFIIHDISLGVPVRAIDRFFFSFRVSSDRSPIIQITNGFTLYYPYFCISIDELLDWAAEEKGITCREKPMYSYDNPFPYLRWFTEDARAVWEKWLSTVATAETILHMLISGLNNYETGTGPHRSASTVESAAELAAIMGNHDLARTLLKDPLLSWSKSRIIQRLSEDLASGKETIDPSSWGPL